MSSQASLGFNDSQNRSSGSSQGSSSSESYIPDYEPQLGFLQQFGNMAGNLANQQYDWAQGQFADNQNLTDQNINGYLANSDMAGGAASRDYQNYNDIFNPAASSLTDDWQSYTSPDRVASEMGRSEAGVGENFENQRQNTERDLRSYGINPSDPRYASAMAASRTAEGASTAAAGNTARLNTEATGRQLRTQALNEAHLLPGQQATEQNVAMQGRTGAQNAAMTNTSLGALTMGTTRDYLNAGIANNKFQPLGTRSSSSNSSNNSSQGMSHGQNSSSGSSIGGGGGSGSKGGGNQGGGSGGSGSGGPTRTDRSSTGPSTGGSYQGQGGSSDARMIQMPQGGKNAQGGTEDDPNDPYFYNDVGMPFLKDPDFRMNNDTEAAPDYSQDGGGGGGDNFDGSGTPFGGDGGEFAQGGAIPDDDDGGGYVPPSMSPSGGEQTDDIPATVQQTGGRAAINAGEFVMPKDVVEYQGHKFFQDLITKARKAMTQNPGPAHPTMHNGVQHHDLGGDPGGDARAIMTNTAGPTGFDGGPGGQPQYNQSGPTQQSGGNSWNWQRPGNTMSRSPAPTMRSYRNGGGFQRQRPMQGWQRPSSMQRPGGGAGFTPRGPNGQPQAPATPSAPAPRVRPTGMNQVQASYWDKGDDNWQRDADAVNRSVSLHGGSLSGWNTPDSGGAPPAPAPAPTPSSNGVSTVTPGITNTSGPTQQEPTPSASPWAGITGGAGASGRSFTRSGSVMFRRGGAIPEAA